MGLLGDRSGLFGSRFRLHSRVWQSAVGGFLFKSSFDDDSSFMAETDFPSETGTPFPV
jgi:hypothetical protein